MVRCHLRFVLFSEFQITWPTSTNQVGSFAIQLAKLSGFKVATTASPKRWELLKSYGADVIVDYKDQDVVKKIKEATGDTIEYGLDCISEGDSTRLAQLAFRPEGGHLITTLIAESHAHLFFFLSMVLIHLVRSPPP